MSASKSRKDDTRTAHFTYIWVIENASFKSLSSKIRSPAFVVQTIGKTKLHLEAEYDDATENFMLFICKEKDGWSASFEIEFEFSLIGEDQFPKQRGESHFQKFSSHRCKAIFNNNELSEPFPNEILTVRCQIWRKGCEVSQSDLCSARTRMGGECHSFVWAIKRFSSLHPGQKRTFSLHPTSETLPSLLLTFSLQEEEGKEYGCIKVDKSPLMGTCRIGVNVYLLDFDGWTAPCIKGKFIDVGESRNFFEKAKLMSNTAYFLPNDVLSLECYIDFNPGPLWSRIENYRQLESSDVEASASEMSEIHFDSIANACCPSKKILRTLYEDGTLSDISLRAGSQSFSVHKNILGVHSPVFKAMFTEDMRKSMAKCVDIPDLNADTLSRLLSYIYTSRVEELHWEGARDLFTAANKYELLDLRERCSDFLKTNLSASNACSILVLANIHNDEDLRKATQDFISQDSDIFYSDAWKVLKEEHTKLALETTEQIICNMRNSRN